MSGQDAIGILRRLVGSVASVKVGNKEVGLMHDDFAQLDLALATLEKAVAPTPSGKPSKKKETPNAGDKPK